MNVRNAYIVAARRSAIGRLGGLHRNRRLEDLTSPVLRQTLDDVGLEPSHVDALILGNTTAGGNPARLISLLAGLPDTCTALTIDRHSASGLEAIVAAAHRIALGENEVIVAGGAESLSTAPWRLAKPRTLFHMPRFVGLAQTDNGESGEVATLEAAEALAARLEIARNIQDEFAITSHIRATLARDTRRLLREIVPLKNRPEETRDELVDEPDIEDMESYPPLLSDGTMTAGNISLPADGAAFVLVVSEAVYRKLGEPPALTITATASIGVPPDADLEAPIAAAATLAQKSTGLPLSKLHAIELSETSAVQAITFRKRLDLADQALNPDGGQIARGNPAGAASAVLAVRLFSRLVRDEPTASDAQGMAVSGAAGGQALAVLFART